MPGRRLLLSPLCSWELSLLLLSPPCLALLHIRNKLASPCLPRAHTSSCLLCLAPFHLRAPPLRLLSHSLFSPQSLSISYCNHLCFASVSPPIVSPRTSHLSTHTHARMATTGTVRGR